MASLVNIQEWLDQCMSQVVSIWCEDPEVVSQGSGGMLGSVMKKSYVTYKIKFKQPGRDAVAVRHRYSEFESLRGDLCDRYNPMGVLVPPLPPKHSMNGAAMTQLLGTDLHETFVKERTLGLTLFCETVIQIPWLRHDNSWKAFLRPTSNAVTDMESNNMGYVQLLACLQQMELPHESTMGARVESIREELILMEKHVKLLLDRALGIQRCERALQAAYDQFTAGLQGYCESEKVTVKSLAGRTFNNDGHSVLQGAEMVTHTSKAFADLWEAKVNANRCMDFYSGVTIITILEQELALIDAMKDLIRTHDDMQNAINSLQAKQQKGHKDPDVLREIGESLQEKKQDLKQFYAGFMYFTLPLAARQRASNFRRFAAGYVGGQTAQSYLLYKACEDFFKNLHMSSCRAVEETNKLLQPLDILPIPTIPATGGDDSEGSDDEEDSPAGPYGGAGGGSVAIIPHVAIHNIRDSNMGMIQHMDNLTASRNHHQINLSASMNRIPRGLHLSPGSTGMNGLFARALMHDKGMAPNTLRTGLPSPTSDTQLTAASTLQKSEGRTNPLAARRGSAVKSNLSANLPREDGDRPPSSLSPTASGATTGTPEKNFELPPSSTPAAPSSAARPDDTSEYVSLRHTVNTMSSASAAHKPRSVAGSTSLDEDLHGGPEEGSGYGNYSGGTWANI